MTSSDDRRADRSSPAGTRGLSRDRLLWLCPIAGLAAAAVILWLFGLTLWTALVLVLLATCPLVLLWSLAAERQRGPIAGKKP